MPVTITVATPDGTTHDLTAEGGAVLRDVLLENDLSPHGRYARRLNCGGNGICATCGVRLARPPDPSHWHDDLAARYGYPRLACQLRVRDGMWVQLLEKRVWGGRDPEGSRPAPPEDG